MDSLDFVIADDARGFEVAPELTERQLWNRLRSGGLGAVSATSAAATGSDIAEL